MMEEINDKCWDEFLTVTEMKNKVMSNEIKIGTISM
jgi:hypothetical protein